MKEQKMSFEEAKKICKDYCGMCPSYLGTGENELLFCRIGKSEVITDEKGCVCGGCPVQKKMGLKWFYYCTKGSSKEQAETEK